MKNMVRRPGAATRSRTIYSAALVRLVTLFASLLLPLAAVAQSGPSQGRMGAAQEGAAGVAEVDPIELVVRPGGQRQLTTVSVPDEAVSGSAADIPSVGEIIRHCLTLSGYFDVFGPSRFFFDANAEGMDAAAINFENWANVGSQALIRTRVELRGGQARLDFRLYDVTTAEEIDVGWESRVVSHSSIRAATWEFVNAVIEYYSGAPGIFGSRVLFAARGSDGNKHIFSMNVDGSDVSRLTSDRTIHLLPAWGPGGQPLYTSYGRDNPDLWIGGGSSARVFASYPGMNTGAALSPDGSQVAVTLSRDGNTEIYILDTQGDIVRRCTHHAAEDLSPTWSPDGSRIAFVSDRSGGPQIFVMNSDCSGQQRVTYLGSYNTSPDWSPSGDRIAFTGRAGGRYDIFVVDPDSQRIERVTQDQGSNMDPTWSPDGRWLMFTSTRGGGGARLYMSTADGLIQRLVTPDVSGAESPAWQR